MQVQRLRTRRSAYYSKLFVIPFSVVSEIKVSPQQMMYGISTLLELKRLVNYWVADVGLVCRISNPIAKVNS
jgi:hypothetical protein